MPKHEEFVRDDFLFSLTGDCITIYDMNTEKKVNQYFYADILEAAANFSAFQQVFAK